MITSRSVVKVRMLYTLPVAVSTAATGSAFNDELVYTVVQFEPPFRLPSIVTLAPSESNVMLSGLNGSGNVSCTHSPRTPPEVAAPV